jgi:hypothetical protein
MPHPLRTVAAVLFLAITLKAAPLAAQGSPGLQRGQLFGVHVITVTLEPHATLDQFKQVFVSRVLPEYEKQWVGLRGYLVQSARGPSKNRLAIVWLFESEAARDRYFTPGDKPNDLEKAALAAIKPIEESLLQAYGSYTITYQDDWVVQ